MATDKLNTLVEKLSQLSVAESSELVKILEERWNVKANPFEGMEMPNLPEEKVKESKTEFDVELTSFPTAKKIAIIKTVRAITGIPLKEAKETIERAPVLLKEGISEMEAEEVKRKLEDDGAVVTIK